jgi:HAD superfamily hydrolase (TIGR01509 family)
VDRISEPSLILPAAILFDMDGTLTEPMLDFPRIKAEMGIGDQPILEALHSLSGSRRAEAEAILLLHEEHAAQNSTLNPGCVELLDWLSSKQTQTALITRNSRVSVQEVLRKHRMRFDVLITREDPPFKPSPHPLLLACQKLNVQPTNAWMLGDGQYDIEAGIAADIRPIWLSHGRPRHFIAEPWKAFHNLVDFHKLLQEICPKSPKPI